MNVDLGIWGKLTRVVIFLLLLAAILAVGAWYYPVIRHNQGMRREIIRLDSQIASEEETNRHLKSSIDSFQNPRTVERLSRERLGYARTGETVIRFESTNRVPEIKR